MSALNVQLLLTGNELMSGDITDTNSVMLAKAFQDLGIEITRRVTVSDNLSQLIDEITLISQQADILIINGGLGPTADDLTAEALATAINSPLGENSQALAHLELWAKNKNITLNQANLKQANLPQNSSIIANRNGSAVGIQTCFNQCQIYCTPGVPRELSVMINEQILPDIKKTLPSDLHAHTTRLHVFGYGESNLQALIDEHFSDWPEEVSLGFRAIMPTLELKLTTLKKEHLEIKALLIEKFEKLLGSHILEHIDTKPAPLAEHVVSLLKEKKLTLATAESCTGGLIASQLTEISGSSQVFEAGFVTYSNSMKTKMLNVSEQTLNNHGAVSEQTVIEMAQGALQTASTDFTIAVTGIAGPTGGTADKPVGTVWVAWGTKDKLHSHCFQLHGTRKYIQQMVTARALDLIRRELLSTNSTPSYLN